MFEKIFIIFPGNFIVEKYDKTVDDDDDDDVNEDGSGNNDDEDDDDDGKGEGSPKRIQMSASKKKLQLKTSFMKIIWIPFYGFLLKVAPPHYPMQSKICSHLLPLLVTYEMTGFALTFQPQMGLLPLKACSPPQAPVGVIAIITINN